MKRRGIIFLCFVFLIGVFLLVNYSYVKEFPSFSPDLESTETISFLEEEPQANTFFYLNEESGELVDLSYLGNFQGYSSDIDAFVSINDNSMALADISLEEISDGKITQEYFVEFKEDSVLKKRTELLDSVDSTSFKRTLEQVAGIYDESKVVEEVTEKVKDYEENLEETQKENINNLIYEIASIRGEISEDYSFSPEDSSVEIKDSFKDVINAVVISLDEEEIEKIEQLDFVEAVYKNEIVEISLNESVPSLEADSLWDIGITGKGIRVAVIDTGIDYTHPAFGSCTKEQFLSGDCQRVVGGYNFVIDDLDPKDDHSHGTHCAGIIGGNGGGVVGVAPEVTFYAYKVLNSGGSGTASNIVKAIERSMDPNSDGDFSDHLDVISLSLGGSGNPEDAMSKAIDAAVDAGVVAVVAAGNNGPRGESILSPGTSRNAITVGASCKTKDVNRFSNCPSLIASFSSRGPVRWNDENGDSQTMIKPDILAPGVNIFSSVLNGEIKSLSGTSMATPHVAGVVALLKQINPEWTPEEIKSRLKETATDLGFDVNSQGAGLVNLVGASGVSDGAVKAFAGPYNYQFRVIPNSKIVTLTKEFYVQNFLSEEYPVTLDFDEVEGIQGSFDKTQFILGAKERVTFNLTLFVDVDYFSSLEEENLFIKINLGGKEMTLPYRVFIDYKLKPESNRINLGTFSPSGEIWEGESNITLTNVYSDLTKDYSVNLSFPSYQDAYGNIVKMKYELSQHFSFSEEDLSFSPAESKNLTLRYLIPNSQLTLQQGKYLGQLTFTSDLDSFVIPVEFENRYVFLLNKTEEDSLVFACLYNSTLPARSARKCSPVLWDGVKEFPVRIYLDMPGTYDLIACGKRGGTYLDYVKKEFVLEDSLSFTLNFSEAKNKVMFNATDEKGDPMPSTTLFSLNNGIILYGFIGGWSNDNVVLFVNNLSEDYFYEYSSTSMPPINFLLNDKWYTFNGKAKQESSEIVFGVNPSGYIKKEVKVHIQQEKKPYFTYFSFFKNMGGGSGNWYNLIDSEKTFYLFVENDSEKEEGFFAISLATTNPLNFYLWSSAISSDKNEVIKGFKGNIYNEINSDTISIGFGPEYFTGTVTEYPQGMMFLNKDSYNKNNHSWGRYFFTTQDFDRILPNFDLKLYNETGLVKNFVKNGTLNVENPLVSSSKYVAKGEYRLEISHKYPLQFEEHFYNATIVFNTSKVDRSPPSFDRLLFSCDSEPCEVLSSETSNILKLRFNPEGGIINEVRVSYLKDNSWVDLSVDVSNLDYLVSLPEFEVNPIIFKIFVSDDSDNFFESIFSMPTRDNRAIELTNCANLDKEGQKYLLNNALMLLYNQITINRSCFNVIANDIEFDCRGSYFIYGSLDKPSVVFNVSANNFILKNCRFLNRDLSNSSYGVAVFGNNTKIFNSLFLPREISGLFVSDSSGDIILLNVSLNKRKFNDSSRAIILNKNKLNLRISNKEGVLLSSAKVKVKSLVDSSIFSEFSTNAGGVVEDYFSSYSEDSSGFIQSYSPYLVSVEKSGYVSTEQTVSLDSDVNLDISLNSANTLSSGSFSSGGGGGGTRSTINLATGGNSCVPDWECSWGECIQEVQTYLCRDVKNCYSEYGKPEQTSRLCDTLSDELLNSEKQSSLKKSALFSSWKIIPLILIALIILVISLISFLRFLERRKQFKEEVKHGF